MTVPTLNKQLSDSLILYFLHHMACMAGIEPTEILPARDHECMHIYTQI